MRMNGERKRVRIRLFEMAVCVVAALAVALLGGCSSDSSTTKSQSGRATSAQAQGASNESEMELDYPDSVMVGGMDNAPIGPFTAEEFEDIYGPIDNPEEGSYCQAITLAPDGSVQPGQLFFDSADGQSVFLVFFFEWDEETSQYVACKDDDGKVSNFLGRGPSFFEYTRPCVMGLINATVTSDIPEVLDVSAPYPSGMYRVGVDIPAGYYSIKPEQYKSFNTASMSMVYVYESEWSTESKELHYLSDEPNNTLTLALEDGQCIDLFLARAVLEEKPSEAQEAPAPEEKSTEAQEAPAPATHKSTCPYEGSWTILMGMESQGSTGYASGNVVVTDETIRARISIDGKNYDTFEGAFSQVTDEGNWMYRTDAGLFLAIGKNRDYGVTVLGLAALGETDSDTIAVSFILESDDAVIPGADRFVGTWQSEYGVIAEFTKGGLMIGHEGDEYWYNLYSVSDSTAQLTGLPDKFVYDNGRLRYELDDVYVYFYRM